jgi:hypothetical protein
VNADDAEGLANKIKEVAHKSARLAQMSSRNLERAQEYRPEVLEKHRTEFYRFLRQPT